MLGQINHSLKRLSRAEKRVAEWVLAHPREVAEATVAARSAAVTAETRHPTIAEDELAPEPLKRQAAAAARAAEGEARAQDDGEAAERLDLLERALDRARGEPRLLLRPRALHPLGRAAVLVADEIRRSEPVLAALGPRGVEVRPAFYDLASGQVDWLD